MSCWAPTSTPTSRGTWRWASLFAANFRLIDTGSSYFVPGIHPSLLTQFWSLAVEEQFYLAFPFIVFVIARFVVPERRLMALSVSIATAVATSATCSAHISAREPSLAYYSPLTRFWELGLGCLLATLATGRPTRTVRSERWAVGAGLTLLVVALATLKSTSTFPGVLAWLPCGATALFIWAGRRGVRTPVTRLLSVRPLGYVGDISYSLYLWHYLWLELPKQLPSAPTGWSWTLLEIGGTVVTAVCSYHLLENPVRRSRRLAADRVAVMLMLGAGAAASWTAAIIVAHLA